MVRVPGYNISVCTGPGYIMVRVPGYNISVCTGPGYIMVRVPGMVKTMTGVDICNVRAGQTMC